MDMIVSIQVRGPPLEQSDELLDLSHYFCSDHLPLLLQSLQALIEPGLAQVKAPFDQNAILDGGDGLELGQVEMETHGAGVSGDEGEEGSNLGVKEWAVDDDGGAGDGGGLDEAEDALTAFGAVPVVICIDDDLCCSGLVLVDHYGR